MATEACVAAWNNATPDGLSKGKKRHPGVCEEREGGTDGFRQLSCLVEGGGSATRQEEQTAKKWG